MTFSARIGQFMAVVGLFVLVIFCATDQANNPAYSFFCAGLLLILSGVVLYLRDRPKPSPSQRFRLFRRKQEDQNKRNS